MNSSSGRGGFAEAWGHESHRDSRTCVWFDVTGAGNPRRDGVGERKTGARGTLNKVMIRSGFHLIKFPRESGWKIN